MLRGKAAPSYHIKFIAISMWFKQFKNCYLLCNMKVNGKFANAYMNATEELLETLGKVIMEEYYFPEQVFNIDETFLFWKRMPERIFILKEASQFQVSMF